MRKLSEETRNVIIELLLSGWTTHDVADGAIVDVGQSAVAALAHEYGIAKTRGAPVGHPKYGDAGRKWGSLSSPHRAEVLSLRAEGRSWQEIADTLGLKSRQHAQKLGKK